MTRRAERPPGFMLTPGALLRDPAFVRLTSEQRGAYFTLLLLLWEGASIPESELHLLSGLGESWGDHRDALAPLFSKSHGRWSIPWLNRYAKRVRLLRQSGSRGAAVTNRERRQLRGSADGALPPRSGSGSGSFHVHEAPSKQPVAPEKAPAPPAAAGLAADAAQADQQHPQPAPRSIDPALIADLQIRHPYRDVEAIAQKCLASPRVQSPERALPKWVAEAEKRDTDRREHAATVAMPPDPTPDFSGFSTPHRAWCAKCGTLAVSCGCNPREAR